MYTFAPNSVGDSPFSHNGLHDMESVVWVAFALLLNATVTRSEYGSEMRDAIVFELFSGTMAKTDTRQAFLERRHFVVGYYEDLFGPEEGATREMVRTMLGVRSLLTRAYRDLETRMMQGGSLGCWDKLRGLHGRFCDVWMACRRILEDADVGLDMISRTWIG